MGLLLDTHVVLWWLADDPKLATAVKGRLNADPEVFVSAASVWEVAIKQALGRLVGDDDLAERVKESGFAALPVGADHAIAAAQLPMHHRDPFDRMLIGQAHCEGLTVMTRDRQFSTYAVPLEYV